MSVVDFFQTMRMNAHSNTVQMSVTYGELSVYDPQTHTAKFFLPLHPDANGNPIETGFIQVGTFFNGAGFGAQFPPAVASQALILFVDLKRIIPIAAVFLNNQTETPPFPDGKSWGWVDQKGSFIKTTTDGASPGDGAGGARISGVGYASLTAGSLCELGAEGLDPTQDAAVSNRYLSQAISSLKSAVQTALNQLAASVQGGSGVAAPTIGAVTTTGSSRVRLKQ